MSLQSGSMFAPPSPSLRYYTEALAGGFAVYDRLLDNRVVRFFQHASSADMFATLGNLLGRCADADCQRPAAVKRTRPDADVCFCLEHFPDKDIWGLVPVPALRLWRED